jgi:hypothetical protein
MQPAAAFQRNHQDHFVLLLAVLCAMRLCQFVQANNVTGGNVAT